MIMYDAPTIGDLIRNPKITPDELSVYSGGNDKGFHKMLAETAVETTAYKMRTDEKYRISQQGTMLDTIFKGLGYGLESAPTPNLIEDAASLLIGPRRPDAIGEMLLTTFPMSKETQRFPYFDRVGSSQTTQRAVNDVNTRGDRHKWIDLKANTELLTGDGVDLNFREDVDAYVIAHWAGSIGTQHFEDLSQKCVDQIQKAEVGSGNFTDASGNTGPKGVDQATSAAAVKIASFDGIVEGITAARKKNWAPDCALLSHDTMAALLKSDDFKDADKFQGMADYNGLTIPTIFNVKLFATSQVTESTSYIWFWEKRRYAFFLVRRYGLVTSWEEKQQNREGLNYTSRYGFAKPDGAALLRLKQGS